MNKTLLLALTLFSIHTFAAEVPVIPAAKPAEAAPAIPPTETPKAEAAAEAKVETTTVPSASTETMAPSNTTQSPAAKKGVYEGMFTFDWKRMSKCQIVGPITNAMLTDSKNICKKADKETGGPASCKVSEKSEYLIFKTLADCKLEYEEQLKASP